MIQSGEFSPRSAPTLSALIVEEGTYHEKR